MGGDEIKINNDIEAAPIVMADKGENESHVKSFEVVEKKSNTRANKSNNYVQQRLRPRHRSDSRKRKSDTDMLDVAGDVRGWRKRRKSEVQLVRTGVTAVESVRGSKNG